MNNTTAPSSIQTSTPEAETIENNITLVESAFFESNSLNRAEIDHLLTELDTHKIDYGDIYFQSMHTESLVLDDNIIKNGSFNIDIGVGIRAVSGEKTGFAYSDLLNAPTLHRSAHAARGIAQELRSSAELTSIVNHRTKKHPNSLVLYPPLNPFETLSKIEKIALLQELNQYIRTKSSAIKEVTISLNAAFEQILVAATDNTYAADIRPLVRLSISVVAEQNGRRERASSGGGSRSDYHYFLDADINTDERKQRAFTYADEVVRLVHVALIAEEAPAGTMPVVLGNGWPGVLLHEALGHGLEGDFNRKETSLFTGSIGKEVSSPFCTIVDDGTIPNRRGSVTIDDEGTKGQYNVLIENGILKGYMQDKLNARLMGVPPTGNGRRESYASLPLPRMTNTYMLPGQSTPEEIISSVEYGLYAPQFSGGQVDITSGQFVFTASEAYLIEKGKITKPVKGATLIGSGIEAMKQVSMVGHDLALDLGVGVCGKEGQSIPVGVGQPTIKVDALTVGGTQ